MIRSRPSAVLAIVLGMILVANSVARLWTAEPSAASPLSHFKLLAEQSEARAHEERRARLYIWSRIAAIAEAVLGAALVLGICTWIALWGVGALLVAFSAWVVYAAMSGWPIEECGCFAGLGSVSVRDHLILNGLLLGLAGLACWLPGGDRQERV